MNIGMVGLGKLGLPVSVCMDLMGHSVTGFDIVSSNMTKGEKPYKELGPNNTGNFNDFLAKSHIRFYPLKDVVNNSDIVFVAVQTPHDPKYEGITRIPDDPADFDYTYLISAVQEIVKVAKPGHKFVLSVISTVMPGTCRQHILPLLTQEISFIYNPFFIAMGTVMYDYLHPEFVLLGTDGSRYAENVIIQFYNTMYSNKVPLHFCSVESAELAKVCYNTYISTKIAFANMVMEMCHKIPFADCDEVIDAICLGTNRIISKAYMRGGMGDGGGCHPRDNIAMSFYAKKLELSTDLCGESMMARQRQAGWLASMLAELSSKYSIPIRILGYSFKPGTNLVTGSPALLIESMLNEVGISVEKYDPDVDRNYSDEFYTRAVYLIGCKKPIFADFSFPEGSVIVDPFRYIKDTKTITVIPVGKGVST